MHNLSASFILGYHGCDRAVADELRDNHPFKPSENDYDWLGSGVYFWEANPDRAMAWAEEKSRRMHAKGIAFEPAVIGAIINIGNCLDLISANGIRAVCDAYSDLKQVAASIRRHLPVNAGGDDHLMRKLDCAVINFLHDAREDAGEVPFDSVRGVFIEGKRIYPTSGFRHKTHIQICVRNPENIHGVFRVHKRYFSNR